MKTNFVIGILLFVFTMSCSQNTENTAANKNNNSSAQYYYGDSIDGSGAITMDELKSKINEGEELAVKVTAPIEAVCQKKGCWMELKANDGSTMRVTFKDYGFFVPKDAKGKQAIVDGVARIEVTSIADLKEYAKDDGKSKEAIDSITEPLKELVFEAKGVILQ